MSKTITDQRLTDRELKELFKSQSRDQLVEYLLGVVRQLEEYKEGELIKEEREFLENLKKEKATLEDSIRQLNKRNAEARQIYEKHKALEVENQKLEAELSKKNLLEKNLEREKEENSRLREENDTLITNQQKQSKEFRQLKQAKQKLENDFKRANEALYHLQKDKEELAKAPKKEKVRNQQLISDLKDYQNKLEERYLNLLEYNNTTQKNLNLPKKHKNSLRQYKPTRNQNWVK